MKNTTSYTHFVKTTATELGFSFCGISKVVPLTDEASRLERWLKQGRHGKMAYMERNFEKRVDPARLVPGARSVISLLYNYYPRRRFVKEDNAPKVSKYAYGEDYHFVIRERLKKFMDSLHQRVGQVQGRVFVDSAPVMERAWAQKSGLGWVGKNSLLLNKQMGSFFFLAELIIDLELDYDGATEDYCGSCTACIDACPTRAIVEPYVVDGSRCISYFTIELREEIPNTMRGKWEDWIFGCDICQDVCPWNRFAVASREGRFVPNKAFTAMRGEDWDNMTEHAFKRIFKKSALKRAGFKGIKRNIAFLKSAKKVRQGNNMAYFIL